MFETSARRLTLDSLLRLGDSFLFVGVGDYFDLPSALIERGKRVLTNDLEDAKHGDIPFIKCNAESLDYESLNYSTLVLQQFCGRRGAGEVLSFLISNLWIGFNSLAIEFCDKESHYLGTNKGLLAVNCSELLNYKGFKTSLYFNPNGARYFLFASKNDLPTALLEAPKPFYVEHCPGDGFEHFERNYDPMD